MRVLDSNNNAALWCGLAARGYSLLSIYGTSGNREMPRNLPPHRKPAYVVYSAAASLAWQLQLSWRCPRCGNMRALRGVRERCGAQQTNRGARMVPGCILSVGFRKSTRALLPMRSLRVRRSGRMHHQGTRRSQIARAPPRRVRTRFACSNQSDRNNTPHTAPSRTGSPSRRAR